MQTDAERLDSWLDIVGDALTTERRAKDNLAGAITDARGAGATWAQLADILGTTRQAAQQRFG